jgi:hypothetical protein
MSPLNTDTSRGSSSASASASDSALISGLRTQLTTMATELKQADARAATLTSAVAAREQVS